MTPFDQLVRIPLFRERSESDFTVERLPGASNRTYKVAVDDECFVLKIPGVQVQPIDYVRNEQRNATLAAKQGIAPEVVWCDARTGVTLFRHVPHSRSLRAADFSSAATLCRALELLRAVHCSRQSFADRLVPWQAVDDYIAQVASAGHRAQERFERLSDINRAVREQLGEMQTVTSYVPSHVDPVPENFINDGERLWLIDWEYAAMADPMWDLAYLASETQLDESLQEQLLTFYFGAVDANAVNRLRQMCLLVELVNLAWTAVQASSPGHGKDFTAAFVRRYERMQACLHGRRLSS